MNLDNKTVVTAMVSIVVGVLLVIGIASFIKSKDVPKEHKITLVMPKVITD